MLVNKGENAHEQISEYQEVLGLQYSLVLPLKIEFLSVELKSVETETCIVLLLLALNMVDL